MIFEKSSYISVQHIPVNVCASEHLHVGVPIIYHPMSTVINHHIGSIFGNWFLFIPVFSILSCALSLCLVLLLLIPLVVLYVFIACSLHGLNVCTRGNKYFVFRCLISATSWHTQSILSKQVNVFPMMTLAVVHTQSMSIYIFHITGADWVPTRSSFWGTFTYQDLILREHSVDF